MKYKVVKKRNPVSGRDCYCVQPVSSGTVTLEDLADEIEGTSTVSRADLVAVLSALERRIGDALLAGNTVRLGDLGSFRVSLRSRPRELPAQVNPRTDVEEVKVRFRPSVRLGRRVNPAALTYRRVGELPKAGDGEAAGQGGE